MHYVKDFLHKEKEFRSISHCICSRVEPLSHLMARQQTSIAAEEEQCLYISLEVKKADYTPTDMSKHCWML